MTSRIPQLLAAVENLSEFSRISGVSRRMLDRYKRGMAPSLPAAVKIARTLNLPLDALVSDASVSIGYSLDSPFGEDVVRIPVLSVFASAGPGRANADELVVDELPFSRTLLRKLGVPIEHAHFIKSRGDSMLPTIPDDAFCLVDTAQTRLRDDQIFAFAQSEDVRVKRVRIGFDGSVTLASDSQQKELYPDERLAGVDVERLNVAGRVFWVEKRL